MSECGSNGCGCAAPSMTLSEPKAADTRLTRALYRIENMDCPTEEALIRDKLSKLPGVAGLEFNLIQRTLRVTHAPDALPGVLAALRSLGFEAEVREAAALANPPAPEPSRTHWWPLAVSGVMATLAEVVSWLNGGNHGVVIALALVAIFTGGLSTYKKGWIALRNRNLNINALMSIAVTGAMLIGHWPEAAMVMVLFALAEVIEAKSLDRARNAIIMNRLARLLPDAWGEIWFGNLADWAETPVYGGDKSHHWLLRINHLLTLDGLDWRVVSPLGSMRKDDAVRWLLSRGLDDVVRTTRSCYDIDEPCLACRSCFRREIAMVLAGMTHDVGDRPLDVWSDGFRAQRDDLIERLRRTQTALDWHPLRTRAVAGLFLKESPT